MEQGSQLARDLARIDLELEAVRRLEHDFAITARHDFITARAQREAERILQLIEEGKHTEAQALMNTDNWGIENLDTTARGKGKGKNKSKGRKGKRHA